MTKPSARMRNGMAISTARIMVGQAKSAKQVEHPQTTSNLDDLRRCKFGLTSFQMMGTALRQDVRMQICNKLQGKICNGCWSS